MIVEQSFVAVAQFLDERQDDPDYDPKERERRARAALGLRIFEAMEDGESFHVRLSRHVEPKRSACHPDYDLVTLRAEIT